MSEYIEIDAELSDDGCTIHVSTNLALTDQGIEEYASLAAMEEGAPLAQALAIIDGIAYLRIKGNNMIITPASPDDWHAVAADVSAAIKDFFL